MSARDTISLAHTARCKLMIAADKPDRNLRFILGHAFTLDKLRLRVLEIENEESSSDEDNEPPIFDEIAATDPGSCGQLAPRPRRVSFSSPARTKNPQKNRSPPPDPEAHHDSESDEEAYEDNEEDEEDGLSLRRFESASARPPRMVEDMEGDEDYDDDNGPVSPTDLDLETITTGPENEELAGLYEHVKGCPCHGQHNDAPDITKAWEVPQKPGYTGNRIAVVQVEA